jgi:hypothetical protein
MTKDALSGHTAAQNTLGADGLRDGDAMSSATLTNTLQGIHGSGLLRLEDNAFTASNRNNPMLQPGAITRASAFTLTITGGYVVLDGVLYEFAGGPGGSATMTLGDANHGSGGVALAATGEEALYVIYVAANNGISNVHYEGGSPVNVSNGLYPTIPSQYLTDYDTASANTNMKTVVLAVVRVKYKSSGGGSHSVDIQEINDKRVFLPSSIRYMPPVSSGGLASNRVSDGSAEGINTMTHLKDLLHTAGDAGDLAVGDSITALWPSHPRYDLSADPQVAATSTDPGFGQGPSRGKDLDNNYVKNALYFAGRNNEGTGHYSVRLDGKGVEGTMTEITGSITKTITSDGDSFIMLKVATGQVVTLNPERDASANYKFPEGHIIEVCNEGVAGKGNIVFDNQTSPAGVNATLTPGDRATFVYEGSKWMSCNYPIAGGGVTDGDKGDITVSSGGNTWTIDNDAVTYAKIQNVSQTNRLLGRDSAGAGVIEEISPADVRTMLNVADGATANAGTVTSVTGTLPISSTGGATPAISIGAASGSAAGSMSSAHFTKLNGIAAGATVYTNTMAVGAIEGAASITLDPSATFTANRSVIEDVTQNGFPISPTALELMEDQRGKVLVNNIAGITTMGLPDPGASLLGDTYVILNTHSVAITIDRGGGLHGTPQNLNGAATNGSLPAHEAVTLIYTGATGWYGIGL